ncbi:glycosyltransferase family 2 protein [Chishuiella changwenlii]|uniref:glycosyltransferase family 2 protein n=1 Tax=Chishuiella changwenlii TaxID=1434701 RepID=UPI002FD9BD98
MKTAIVILNWNGAKLLPQFLPSVINYSKDAEVYIIDNASTDNSIHLIKTEFPSVKIIQNKGNYGFAKGYNEGLKQINAEYFCLLNSDVEVTENWLQPIEELFDQNNDIAAIQPKILDYKNKKYFEYAGAGGGFIDKFGYPFCRGRVFSTLEEDKGQYNDTTQIFWASGASLFIRSKDFFAQNGFDEDFFAHMEEIDLCWRLNNANRKIYYCGQSTVYHLGGATLDKSNPKKWYLNYRNSLWMLLKNLPKEKLFPVIFTRLSLDGIAAIAFLPKQGLPHVWSVFISHVHFYLGFIKMYKKRQTNQNKNYSNTSLLPVQFFLKKRQYFKDLK